jgi:ribosomal protein L37AE/L43A
MKEKIEFRKVESLSIELPTCPKCKIVPTAKEIRNKSKRCSICGQKLDWTPEELRLERALDTMKVVGA